ncbi:MAG: type I polyketide synthase [Pirellulales bacterium]|nr:type I polyketide synthase [Pirellulales bacterium]
MQTNGPTAGPSAALAGGSPSGPGAMQGVAIVGMAGRFPGARSIAEFWDNLCRGVESIRHFSDDELRAAGVDEATLADPTYVKASPVLDDVEGFDAALFDYTPREARLMDPQHRLFLETAWEALEDAGYDPLHTEVPVGVYGGAGGLVSSYGFALARHLEAVYGATGSLQHIANDKDYLATRVSFKLNLRGPSMTVQSACSTSLVAVHVACQSLLAHECDLALAGGSTVRVPHYVGYHFEEGGIVSPDGHCRAFDAGARGTLFGSGVGVVALKRLSDALAAGDPIYAVIKASAVNNDGGAKLSFTSTSEAGQMGAMAEALAMADCDPATLGLVEAHGTATAMGDPVEVSAMAKAFRGSTSETGFCALGSVKSNIGHLEAAAGVAGLIKAALAVYHGKLPPTLHFEKSNPRIDFPTTPFYPNLSLKQWPPQLVPRRAGVNSLGIGGTNAFVVLEQAPAVSTRATALAPRSRQLICLSARTAPALSQLAARYVAYLDAHPQTSLADVAYTTNVGRVALAQRAALVVDSAEQLRERLADIARDPTSSAAGNPANVSRGQASRAAQPKVAWVVPGTSSELLSAAPGYYAAEPVFRAAADRCLMLLEDQVAKPLDDWLAGREASDEVVARGTASFVAAFALAQLWRAWGVQPAALVGAGHGELAAACLAGALDLRTSLQLAAALDAGDETFRETASSVMFGKPQLLWVSASTGRPGPKETPLDAADWLARLRSATDASGAGDALAKLGVQVALLLGGVPAAAADKSSAVRWIASCPASASAVSNAAQADRALQMAVARLWTLGVAIDWRGYYRDRTRPRLPLPTYPFQHERYWLDVPATSAAATTRAATEVRIAPAEATAATIEESTQAPDTSPQATLIGRRVRSPLSTIQFESQLGVATLPLLGDHWVYDKVVIPGACHLSRLIATARAQFGPGAITLGDVLFPQAVVLAPDEVRPIQLLLDPQNGGHEFKVVSYDRAADSGRGAWRVHAQGEVSVGPAGELPPPLDRMAFAAVEKAAHERLNLEQFYGRMAEREIHLGPRFHWNDQTAFAALDVVSRMRLPAADQEGFLLHPGLIDACFQILIAKLATTYVPFSVETLRVSPSWSVPAFCHARFREQGRPGQAVLAADLVLYDDAGRAIVEMRGLRLKAAARDALLQAAPTAGGIDRWLYKVAWREVSTAGAVMSPPAASNLATRRTTWLLLADDPQLASSLAGELVSRGQACIQARWTPNVAAAGNGEAHAAITPERIDELARRVQSALDQARESGSRLGVIALLAGGQMDSRADHSAEDGAALARASVGHCALVTGLVQTLVRAGGSLPTPLWLVTRGALNADPDEPVRNLAASSLWGLGRVIATEHPELACVRVDLDPMGAGDSIKSLAAELSATDREDQVVLRGGSRFVQRLTPLGSGGSAAPTSSATTSAAGPQSANGPVQLTITERGTLGNLQLVPRQRQAPAAGQVEIEVRAAGLNFRDVLNALGRYPGDPGDPGLECAGVVTAVGPGVVQPAVGDEVVATGFGLFSTYAITRAALAVRKPARLSFADAASVPVTFLTALYGLKHLAKLSAGQRVLIPAAAGGVGVAAVQMALAAGAEIFATAGSEEKREYLKSLGVQHVLPSRTLEFADEVRRLTGGAGVDVVLNSLAGDYIPKSLELVRPGGHFLEIGKTGIWTAEQVAEYRPGVHYATIALDAMFDQQPELVGQLTRELMEMLANGQLKAPPRREFALDDAVAGFRYMAQAKHIGKVVLTMPAVPKAASDSASVASSARTTDAVRAKQPIEIRGNTTYLITGGLGGLGRRIAQWLVERGARHLVLVGRRPPNESAAMQIAELQGRGVQVRTCQVEAANLAEIPTLVKEIDASPAPLAGVIHAAGVLDDGVLVGQTAERFAKVFAPKVAGAWNLDRATQSSSLDFFVLFSSLAAWLGSSGQGNYAAANSLLDALAADRHARGLPATSIAWGPWAEAGMAAGLGEAGKRRFAAAGIELIPPSDGLVALGRLLDQPEADVAVLPVDWAKFLAHSSPGQEPAMLRELAASSRASAARRERGAVSQTSSATAQRDSAAPADASPAAAARTRENWQAAILDAATRVLGTDSGKQLASDQPLTEQGLDSLLAIELVGALRKLTGRNLPAALVFDYPTIDALAAFLAASEPAVPASTAAPQTMSPTQQAPLAATIAAATAQSGSSAADILALVKHETSKVLGVDGAALATGRPLVDLGLDSLLAIELVGALRKATGRGLPATLVFDHPTIDALAAHLTATSSASATTSISPVASTTPSDTTAVVECVTVSAPTTGAGLSQAEWRTLIAQEAGKVLGVDGLQALAADRPLTEQGLDSLLAIELVGALRKASGRSLPATLVFDHPTLDDLSKFLADAAAAGSATNGAAHAGVASALPAAAPIASPPGATTAPIAAASRTMSPPAASPAGEFDFVVEDLRIWHADELPELHIKAFPGYFLTLMGPGFLKRFYAEFCLHPFSYGCVARSKRTGKLVAVATGSANVPAHFKHFYRSHAPYLAMCIATKSITNADARRAVLARTSHAMHALRMLIPGMRPPASTAAVSDKDPPNQCPVRFLSMGIDPEWRATKASIETTLRFEEIVRAAGNKRYGCSILAHNDRAIGFFTGMGFEMTFRSSKGCWFEKDL